MIEVPDVYFCMTRNVKAQSKYYQYALAMHSMYTNKLVRNTSETKPIALNDFTKQDLLKIKHCLRHIIIAHGLHITGLKGMVEFKDHNEVANFTQRIIMEDYYFLRVYLTPQI
jgi:hypothetical protein